MSSTHDRILKSARGDPAERELLAPLLFWLLRTGRCRAGARVALEFSWLGRRVDVASLSSAGRMTAYELKIGRFGRALEQALYNRQSFDRSYVVTEAAPSAPNLVVASNEGIGVIVVAGSRTQVLLESPFIRAESIVRSRLRARLESTGLQVGEAAHGV